MRRNSLSFDEVVRHDVLRQAQVSVQIIAEHLDSGEVIAQPDYRSGVQDPRYTVTPDSSTVRTAEDGIVIVISPKISQNHFDPYKLAVFASNEIQGARIRAELQTWIEFASNELHSPREHLVNDDHLFVKWFKSLSSDHSPKLSRLAKIAQLAGLVAQYCHPHTDAGLRAETLDELRGLANEGVNEADEVFKLLTSPSSRVVNKHEAEKQKDFVDSPITGIRLQIVEDSYEIQIKKLVKKRPDKSPFDHPLTRLIQETKLSNKPVQICFAGTLEDIHSIYCLYTILKYQVDTLKIPNVQIDTGVIDATYYINTDESYVRHLTSWFNKSRPKIPCLAHLVQSAANNDISEFRIKQRTRHFVPTAEQLVLFYLRMLSNKWNILFESILDSLGKRGLDAQRDYWAVREKVARLVPKDWRSAMDAHSRFAEFMRRERPKYRQTINALQPINPLTDNQINQATLIVMASRESKTHLVRRFPKGVAGKIVFLSEMSLRRTAHSYTRIESPFTPSKFLSDARWDLLKEESIEKDLLQYVVPSLRQDISTEKIKAVKLVQQKRASRNAIESVKQYVTHLQTLSLHGHDKALIDGLTFLSAVMQDIDPCSNRWNQFVDRDGADRETVNKMVFGTKTRTLSDAAAITFLTHYVGPKMYVDKVFPVIYQKHNDEVLAHLVRRLGKGGWRSKPARTWCTAI